MAVRSLDTIKKLDENAIIYQSEIIMNLLLSLLFMIYRERMAFLKEILPASDRWLSISLEIDFGSVP